VERLLAFIKRAGIARGEVGVFLWGAATSFLIGWASVSLANVSDTLFLKRVGVTLLPAVFLGSSLLLVVTTFGVARIAARTSPVILMRRTFIILPALLLPLWLLVLADIRSAFVLLVIAAKQFESVALMVFWVALGGLLHGRQAKRLYAPIIAGGTLGELTGSFASGAIGDHLGIAMLIPVGALAFGLAALLAVPLGTFKPVPITPTERRPRGARRARAILNLVSPLWRGSRLFQLLVLSALLSGVLGPILYYQFSYLADQATQGSGGEQQLLDLYAWFRGYLNIGVLAVQLIGTAWLFRRIGVPLASTLSPLVYVFGFLGFSLQLGLPVAIVAMAGASLQDHAIYDPAQKILVTLFPERVRPAATTLLEGPVRRVGGTLGNIVVLCVLAFGTSASVSLVGLPIAVLWLAVAVVLWRIYPALLLEVARERPLRLERQLPLPELVDQSTLRVLETSLTDPDPQCCRAACALIAEMPQRRAVEAVARALGGASSTTRSLLVTTLHRLMVRHAGERLRSVEALQHLDAYLASPDLPAGIERAHLLQTYADLALDLGPGSRGARVLMRFLDDPDECVRVAATARLHRGGALPAPSPDIDTLLATTLLRDDPHVRHIALEELRATLMTADGVGTSDAAGAGVWEFRIAQLAALLESPADRARAADILCDLAARYGARVAPIADLVLVYKGDPDPRVRTAVLRFVGHAKLEQHAGWAVESLASDDESEAAAAHDTLLVLGPAAIDALLDALHFGKRAIRDAVLPLLREMPVDTATLRGLIDRQIDAIRRTLLQRHGLSVGQVSDLALQRLVERADENVHATLLLMATLLHDERIAVVARLLARSRSGRARAVLVEALEVLLPPQERERIMPLLEDREFLVPAAAAAEALGRKLPSFEEALRDSLAEPDQLTADLLGRSREPGLSGGTDLGDDGTQRNATEDTPVLSRFEIVLHLRGLELFSSLTTRQLRDLAEVVREEAYQPEALIVREGEFGDCMYLVVTGEVSVTREGRLLARVQPREFFGEMALFDGEMRSATAVAASRVRLLRLERHDFFQIMDEQPAIAIAVCQTLSRRVRNLLEELEKQ